MYINMVFTLLAEFRDAEEEITQMCLRPKESVIKKPKESSQHLKPLYIRGHIDRKLISWMLIDGSAGMSYPVFKPKPSTHRMHDPRSNVPHIRPKVLTENQMS
jgi:hypothetical protein